MKKHLEFLLHNSLKENSINIEVAEKLEKIGRVDPEICLLIIQELIKDEFENSEVRDIVLHLTSFLSNIV